MQTKQPNMTLLIGAAAVLLFILAAKTRHPVMILVSIGLIVITYRRFRHNYLIHRLNRAKHLRRSGAIDVEVDELKTRPRDLDVRR